MSETKEHKILVGYQEVMKIRSKVFFLAPLYDMNDKNMDGNVSVLESWYGKNLYDPYSVFKLFNQADNAACAIDVGVQMKDYFLRDKAARIIKGGLHCSRQSCKHDRCRTVIKSWDSANDRCYETSSVKQNSDVDSVWFGVCDRRNNYERTRDSLRRKHEQTMSQKR